MVAVVVVVSGLGVSFFIGRDLLQIKSLAGHTRSEVIPFAVAESERALDAERLGRYAETVVLSRDVESRRTALDAANGLARRLAGQLPDADRSTLHTAIVSVRAAARHNDRVDQLTGRIDEALLRSGRLLAEAKEIIEAIAAESSTELETALDDLIEFSTHPIKDVRAGLSASAKSQHVHRSIEAKVDEMIGLLSVSRGLASAAEVRHSEERFRELVAETTEMTSGLRPLQSEYGDEISPRIAELGKLASLLQARARLLVGEIGEAEFAALAERSLAKAGRLRNMIGLSLYVSRQRQSMGFIDRWDAAAAEAIGKLEEKTASLPTVNETSNRLLATVGLMRATLLGLPTAEDDARVKELTESYQTLSNRLQVMLVLLGGRGQSERLGELITAFRDFSDVFPLQTLVLAERRMGRREGSTAIAALSSLTKRLTMDASRIATRGVEEIEARIGDIMRTAVVAAAFMAAVAALLALIGRRAVVVPLVNATRALDALRSGGEPVPLPPVRLYELDALAQSLESFRAATLQIKRLAAEQAEKSQLLESILANVDQGILALDREHRLASVNARFREIFGVPSELCANGAPFAEIVRFQAERGEFGPAEGADDHALARLASGAASLPCHFEHERPEGAVVEARGNAMPGGGLVTTFTDITERKRAEQTTQDHARKLSEYAKELERSNSELEQFAYVASHDLQEPLRMVSSYCQLLQRRYKDKLDDNAEEFIAFAVEGAARMQRLINDLLAYSRVGTRGKPFEPTDCDEVLAAALANLQAVVNDTAAEITHDPLPTVVGDPVQLVQLLQNLLGNAIKFRQETPVRIHVSAKPNGGDWIFSVQDNGIGIDPQYTDRIFIIFQRLHERAQYPGTGIGLAVCKKIVERHGGRIWVEPAPGHGSTFLFTIPEFAPVSAPESDPEPARPR